LNSVQQPSDGYCSAFLYVVPVVPVVRAVRVRRAAQQVFAGVEREYEPLSKGEKWALLDDSGPDQRPKAVNVLTAWLERRGFKLNEADLRAMGIHTVKGKLVEEPETDPDGVWIEDIETWKVIYLLLKKAPHAWMRQLLDDLGVRVYINPPWTREERAERGFTPASERVIVRLLADPNDDNQVRPSETKPNTSE
jgi:hypothetical protein